MKTAINSSTLRRPRRAAQARLRGHDVSLIEENLRKTPGQRLADHEKARRLLMKLHGALSRDLARA